MSDVSELQARIDGAFTTAKAKAKQEHQAILQDYLGRQKLLKQYEEIQDRIVEIAKPRLEALAKRAGERVKVTPAVSQARREVTFKFRSNKAHITLTFAVAPDLAVKNAFVESDLRVIPVLWRYDAHSEFFSPIATFDADGLTKWLDERIVGFVELFIKIHESELYDKTDYVEDPVAGIKFPKFAAGATLEHGGQTHFFIDATTQAEFARQKGLATA